MSTMMGLQHTDQPVPRSPRGQACKNIGEVNNGARPKDIRPAKRAVRVLYTPGHLRQGRKELAIERAVVVPHMPDRGNWKSLGTFGCYQARRHRGAE